MEKVSLIDFAGGFSRKIRPDLLADNVCQEVINCEVNQSGLLELRSKLEIRKEKLEIEGVIVWSWYWNSFHRYEPEGSRFEVQGSEGQTHRSAPTDHVLLLTYLDRKNWDEDGHEDGGNNDEGSLDSLTPTLSTLTPTLSTPTPTLSTLTPTLSRGEGVYILWLWVGEHVVKLFEFSEKPSVAVTDRKVYVLGSEDYLQYVEILKDKGDNGGLDFGVYDVACPVDVPVVVNKSRVSHSVNRFTELPFGALLQYCYTFVDDEGKESKPSGITSYFGEQFLWEGNYLRSVELEIRKEKLEIKRIESVRVYRRYAVYSESWEGFSPFSLVYSFSLTPALSTPTPTLPKGEGVDGTLPKGEGVLKRFFDDSPSSVI